jgi:hypothetical protein
MATRWSACGRDWRTMVQAAVAVAASWASAKWLWATGAVLRPGRGDDRARQSSYTSAAGGRSSSCRGHARDRGADVLALESGPACVQLGVAVSIAIGVGVFFGTSQLFVNQVAISAALVVHVTPPHGGFSFARALDALTGGVIALAVAAVLLPADPLRILRGRRAAGADELAETLRAIAGRCERVTSSPRRRRWSGRGRPTTSATSSPPPCARGARRRATRRARRGSLGTVEAFAAAAAQIDPRGPQRACARARRRPRGPRWVTTCRRRSPAAIEDLADAVVALEHALDRDGSVEPVRELALRAATTASQVLERTGNLSVSVIVGQIRSTAVDLLAGTGMEGDEAIEAVRAAIRAGTEEAEPAS